MTIDVFTAAGQKKGTMELPPELFGSHINQGLIHQALVMQQSNRRSGIAHAKNRHEVAGSTRKLYAQKHTGRARRGSIRSPLLRGGGKAFGPRKEANFDKSMPKAMRRSALFSCLSFQAKKGSILGLESYPATIKTKALAELLQKLPVDAGRKVLFVIPEKHEALFLSCRNLHNVKTILVSYLNPEDIVASRSIVFVGDAVEKAMQLFGTKGTREQKAKMQRSDAEMKKSEEKQAKPKKQTTPQNAKKMSKANTDAKAEGKPAKAKKEKEEADKPAPKKAAKPRAKKSSESSDSSH